MTPNLNIQPDIKVSLKQTFGIESEMEVDAFSKKNEFVPEIDKSYKFDRDTFSILTQNRGLPPRNPKIAILRGRENRVSSGALTSNFTDRFLTQYLAPNRNRKR